MTVRPALLDNRERDERVMDGWVDNTHEDALTHSMHDDAHGFEITYEVDAASGRILSARSLTPKLPYMGICFEAQGRIDALVGESLDDGLRKRIQAHLGGATGCAQLYDLTPDLLKLVYYSALP